MVDLGLAVRHRDAPSPTSLCHARLRVTSLLSIWTGVDAATLTLGDKRLPVHHIKQVSIELVMRILVLFLLQLVKAADLGCSDSQIGWLLFVILVARAWTGRAAPTSVLLLFLGRVVLHL